MKSSAKWFAGVAAIVLLLTGLVVLVSADDPKKDAPKEQKDKKPKASKGDPAVKTLGQAFTMAAIGREHKLPEALIAAAKLAATVKVTLVEGSDKEAAFDSVAEAQKWLAEAQKMPEATLTIKKLIDTTGEDLKSGTRGATYGAQQWPGKVGALQVKSKTFRMKGSCTVSLLNNGLAAGGMLSLSINGDVGGPYGGSDCMPGGICEVNFDADPSGENVTVTITSSDDRYILGFLVLTN